ncbi:putative protein phosphatase 2C 33 [Platanthera zijinensis]|uniref:Uncharacterized protein n=1 Tax=Platanthera zijinensis TaxID=2320716 RepID=A0AAP0BQM0_9ASPA
MHNGISAAVFTKDHLLDHIISAIPPGIGETSGTTVTLLVIDGLTVTVASVPLTDLDIEELVAEFLEIESKQKHKNHFRRSLLLGLKMILISLYQLKYKHSEKNGRLCLMTLRLRVLYYWWVSFHCHSWEILMLNDA